MSDDTETPSVLDLLRSAMRGGFKTSEFWLAVFAICAPWLVDHLNTMANSVHGTALVLVCTISASIVSGVYTWVRGHSKTAIAAHMASVASAEAGEASGTIPKPTNGNVLVPPEGR